MTDSETSGTGLEDYFLEVRQGDVFELSTAIDSTNTDKVAIISQTCDIVLAKRPTVIVAAVCTLGETDAEVARRRDNPRYVEIGEHGFVDLCHITSVEKSALIASNREHAIDQSDDASVRVFALAIGRWFSRFAVPDAVVPWLRPLQSAVRSKYDKPTSPLGQVLRRVAEIRIQADNWTERPLELQLHVIVLAGEVPTFEDPPELANEVGQKLRTPEGAVRSPHDIAEVILADLSPAANYYAWGSLVESLAALCKPPKSLKDPDVTSAVNAITGQLWADDEFPLSRIRKSELLDLDYLSGPTPL